MGTNSFGGMQVIKGCNKRVIVMKDTGNSMIEEAFFILKPGSEKGLVSEEDIVKHANSILSERMYNDRFSSLSMNVMRNRQKKRGFLQFFSGIAVGAATALAVIFVI